MEQLVSVVIPAYNAEKYIAIALKSVCLQTYANLEILVVNDASADQTVDVVRRFMQADKRIRLINLEQNGGVAHARNVGVQAAGGRYVAFLDSDDLWCRNKIRAQMAVVRTKHARFVFTGSSFIDESGHRLSSVLHVPESITDRELLKQNVISCSSVLLEKEVYVKHPMPDGEFHEDFATWLQILRDGVTAYGIDEPLLIHRMLDRSRSGNKLHSAVMNYRAYRYVGLSSLEAIRYELIYICRGIRKYGKIHRIKHLEDRGKPAKIDLEVLISCMNQEDFSIAEKTGVKSDTLMINQCPADEGEDVLSECRFQNHRIRMLTVHERGLSRSRNLAIRQAKGNVVLICDDDETLNENYVKIINHAYQQIPDADIIAFKMENQECRLKPRAQRLTMLTCLRISSWQISFKPESVKARNIHFDVNMGAGTGNGAGEEVKFLRDCIKAGLKAYYVPEAIGTVKQTDSTWFKGFSREFFYQRGITNRYMLGLPLSIMYAVYYTIVKRKKYQDDLSMIDAFLYTMKGIMSNDIAKDKRKNEQ